MDWLSFALGGVIGWSVGSGLTWAFVVLIGWRVGPAGGWSETARTILEQPTHAEWRVERRPARED